MNYFSNLTFLAFLLIISSSQAKNTLSSDGEKKSVHHKSRASHYHVPSEKKSISLSREKEQNALYYKSKSSRSNSKAKKASPSSFMKVHYMEGTANNELSDQTPYHFGNSTVEIIERKNGLIYFKLRALGISNDAEHVQKNTKDNPDIIWTLPESSNIENGSVLSLHTFKDPDAPDDPRKKATSHTKGFYVPYYKP